MLAFSASCGKSDKPVKACDIDKVRADNAPKVTITQGLYGTLSLLTGNCIPMVPPNPNACSQCPVKRTIRIYEPTTTAQATPTNGNGWYDSFSTKLLKEFSSDDNGFYQVEIDPGTYTIVALDSGKLYSFGVDIQSGGISEVRIAEGKQNADLMMVINAVF